jgi:hypothetical protein
MKSARSPHAILLHTLAHPGNTAHSDQGREGRPKLFIRIPPQTKLAPPKPTARWGFSAHSSQL